MPVVAKLCGGLGNQMFQYAAARRLATVNNQKLYLDTVSRFRSDPYGREYLLDQFNIKAEKASIFKSYSFPGAGIRRRLDNILPYKHKLFHEEKDYQLPTKDIDERLLTLRKKCIILEGNWQSEKYFEDIQDVIRDELQTIVKHHDSTLREAEEIRSCTSIGMGVRLYEEVPHSSLHHHPVLKTSYFITAMNKIATQIENAHFFVTSDNIERTKKELDGCGHKMTFLSEKKGNKTAREDMWLLSLCDHHIISNSSYHWWGAWLGESKESVVMVPNYGTNNLSMFPKRWKRVTAEYKDPKRKSDA